MKHYLRKHQRLVCLTHASNVTGSIYDIRAVLKEVRRLQPNALTLVDASQAAGFAELSGLDEADFIVFPAHKHLHALPGAAVLVARKPLKTIIFGGTGVRSGSLDTTTPDSVVAEVGTSNIPAIVAMVAALEDYVENRTTITKHVNDKVRRFWTSLDSIDGVKPIGRAPGHPRTGIVAVKVQNGLPEQEWVPVLRTFNVVVRGGLHCSPLFHQQLGLEETGTLRFSFSRYSRDECVDKAIEALNFAAEMFGKT